MAVFSVLSSMDYARLGKMSNPEFLRGPFAGPILFLIYVNDMPNVTTGSTLAMFADDSKCYKSIESIADFDIIQADLDNHLCLFQESLSAQCALILLFSYSYSLILLTAPALKQSHQ